MSRYPKTAQWRNLIAPRQPISSFLNLWPKLFCGPIDRRQLIGLSLLGDVHVGPQNVISKLLRCELATLLIYTNPRMMVWSYELVRVAQRLQFSRLIDRAIESRQTWESLENIDKQMSVLKGIGVIRAETAYRVAW